MRRFTTGRLLGFNIGDKVIIIKNHNHDYGLEWTEAKEKYIGQICTIKEMLLTENDEARFVMEETSYIKWDKYKIKKYVKEVNEI